MDSWRWLRARQRSAESVVHHQYQRRRLHWCRYPVSSQSSPLPLSPYRELISSQLGAFGFLSSDEVYRNGVANAGILDQHFGRHALPNHIVSLMLNAMNSSTVGPIVYWTLRRQCVPSHNLRRMYVPNLSPASPVDPLTRQLNSGRRWFRHAARHGIRRHSWHLSLQKRQYRGNFRKSD